jgi:hypothetical protein
MGARARGFACVLAAGFLALAPAASRAQADITPAMTKVILGKYQKQLADWAAHPEIVNATREANQKGPVPGMANAKWRELKAADPMVTSFVVSTAGQLLTKWMKEDAAVINRIVLSGDRGQRVAFTEMPAAYLGKGRPNFDTSFDENKFWQQPQIQPDPVTQIPTIQVSQPVRDGGKVIGVLLVALTAAALK